MKRLHYVLIIIFLTITGLASRKFSQPDTWIHLYIGDVLWAMLFYFFFRLLIVSKHLKISFLSAVIWSYAIELLQLYHAPWIEAIRRTKLGGLLLGFGFLWSDLICYTVGAFLGYFIDKTLSKFVAKP